MHFFDEKNDKPNAAKIQCLMANNNRYVNLLRCSKMRVFSSRLLRCTSTEAAYEKWMDVAQKMPRRDAWASFVV